MPTDPRPHDIVLLGATGFTGALIAQQLVTHAPPGATIGLAGRNREKLDALAASLERPVELIETDVSDQAQVEALARSARVLASTVGPYVLHGEPAVAACAAAGTDYVDLTGEPEFVDRTYVRHHATAQASGARLVHACGFDSIPHDLGVQMVVETLPEGVPIDVRGYVTAKASFSGGTAASALEIMSRLRAGQAIHRQRVELEGAPEGRRVTVETGRIGPIKGVGGWAIPLPTVDPQIVALSARQLERYGPAFSYAHFMAVDSAPIAVATLAGMGALLGAAQIPAARRAITARQPAGSGPSPDKRERSWFSARFIGSGGGQSSTVVVSGGDPGYTETSKMISQAALCLAFDDLPETAGQVTTASAMGPALRARLIDVGISFRRELGSDSGPPTDR